MFDASSLKASRLFNVDTGEGLTSNISSSIAVNNVYGYVFVVKNEGKDFSTL